MYVSFLHVVFTSLLLKRADTDMLDSRPSGCSHRRPRPIRGVGVIFIGCKVLIILQQTLIGLTIHLPCHNRPQLYRLYFIQCFADFL